MCFRLLHHLLEFYRDWSGEEYPLVRDHDLVERAGAVVLERSFLPAPLHTTLSFLSFPFLDASDKLAISRAMAALIPRQPVTRRSSGLADGFTAQPTHNAIERFWKPVLVSALSEDLELVSVAYAGQVVRSR